MVDSGSQWSTGIRTPDQRLRVFVSSTLEELATARSTVRTAIEQLRLAPVMFESGARPHPAQAVYRAYLEQSDVFIGIYWQSYGWIAPGMTISGLEDEFRLAADIPRLLYVKVPAPDMDPALDRMLDKIRAEGQSAYKTFTDTEELHELVLTDLATMLAERFEGTGRDVPGRAAPSPVTTLVGRDEDIDEVVRLLEAEDRRIVVLTGTGGIGKTRLALAAMERSRPHWQDGAVFVDLSSITDQTMVPDAIALALSVVVQGRETSVDALVRRLATRNMLLVLDNFEQVLEAASVVADLAQRAPSLHLLVTSRVVLRVLGEQEWRVDPLDVPAVGATETELASSPAVQLFVERVRDVAHDFELTSENASAVAELCRRLCGLPLALELAAAWMRLLTPEQMLAGLYERLESPGALVDLPDRQQTLTSTIEWSYDLLPAAAQQLLLRLSVFAAPFTVEAAEAVCGRDDVDGMEALSKLLDHSMVSPAVRADGERAFQLLDPIRRFAAARLVDADETLGHLERYVLDVFEAAGARHGSQDSDMRRLDSEQLNLQVVIRWIASSGRSPGPVLRALGDVWVWLQVRRHLRRHSGLSQRIESLPESGLRTDSDRVAWSWLKALGLLTDGRLPETGAVLDEIMPTARRLEKPSRVGLMLSVRALSRPYSADGPAHADFEEATAITRGEDDRLVFGYVLSHYGMLRCVDGDTAGARSQHEEALAIARAIADENLRAETHYDLAMDATSAGDFASAEAHLALAARHYQDIDHIDGIARCLAGFVAPALERGSGHLAASLIGATAAARDGVGLTPWPVVAEVERRTIKRAEASLSSGDFTTQVAAGRSQTIQDALAGVLDDLGDRATTASW